MLKGLSRLWLRAVKRMGKAQHTKNKKLVKSLFDSKPLVAKRTRRPAKTADTKIKSKAVSSAIRTFPSPGQWVGSYYTSLSNGTLPVRRMGYRLYLPASVQNSPLPLVVMLHGCQQSATEFSQGTRMNHLAEKKGFAVLYPQQSLGANRHRCWHWYDKGTQDGNGEASLIAGVIDSVRQKYAIDHTRIYVAGLSAGAAMANILALNYPQLIAAVGLHSAPAFGVGHTQIEAYAVMQHGSTRHIKQAIERVLNRFPAFPKMPVILIHGDADKIVRSVNLPQLALQFRLLNKIPVGSDTPVVLKAANRRGKAYKTHDYYIGRKLMIRVCDVIGLEHAWSGGDCALVYNSCAGPDASKMMWDFFARHQRPVLQN